MDQLANNPLLQHSKLTPREMAMICDVCNPGFEFTREIHAGYENDMVATMLRANVQDSFSMYPGEYEKKWKIDRERLLTKLREMTTEELNAIANQVDEFWRQQ